MVKINLYKSLITVNISELYPSIKRIRLSGYGHKTYKSYDWNIQIKKYWKVDNEKDIPRKY